MLKIVDFSEFKRGMIGLLKILMFEALETQRLDHYALYKSMLDITTEWQAPDISDGGLEPMMEQDEEAVARMVLNFPKDECMQEVVE